MKKTGIILSGCGVYDGAEIHETVLTLLALNRAGAEAVCFAPNIEQLHVIDHQTGNVMGDETRNVLTESARLCRGNIRDLADIDTSILDALIIPGGFGAAKNLCDYALKGAECSVNPDVANAIRSFYKASKPIGFLCIAPVIAARVLGSENITVTIGNDPQTASDIEAMGARHVNATVGEAVVSPGTKIVSTPAYMLGTNISDVATGINALVHKVLELVASQR